MAEQSKTVDSALSLLALVARTGDSPTAAALARSLGVSRTAVARLLATLENHGLVRRTATGWGPGLALLALADGIEPQLRALARDELEGLAARFGETAVLSIRDGDDAVAVDQVLGDGGVVRIHYRPGTRHPLTVAASGRALLEPAADDRDADEATGGVGPGSAVASEGELEPGVRGMAAAVRGPDGRPLASIAVVAPVHRFPPDDDVARAVTAAAARIGAGIGAGVARGVGVGAGRPSGPGPSPDPGGTHALLPPGG